MKKINKVSEIPLLDERDINYHNGWRPFTKETKVRGRMLFWDKKQNTWFEGNLIDDSEYGLVISLYDSYKTLQDISYYKLINTP